MKIHLLHFVIALLLGSALTIVGFYFFVRKYPATNSTKPLEKQTEYNIPLPTPTLSRTTSLPAPTLAQNWNTYSNTEYSFSFQYPKDWEIRDLQPANASSYPERLLWIGYGPQMIKEDVLGMIEVTTLSVEDKIAKYREVGNNSNVATILPTDKKISLRGVTATELTMVNQTANHESKVWIFSYKGKTYQVTAKSTDSAFVEQIANTFILE